MSRKTSSSAPSRGVALGELGRIALVDEVDEPRALDDAAVRDVEAGDDAAAEHQARRPRRAGSPSDGARPGRASTKLASSRRPSRAAPLGVELDAEHVRPRATALTNGRRGPSRPSDDRSASGPVGDAGVGVDEVEVGVGRDAGEQRVLAAPLDLVPADVRAASARRRAGRVRPGDARRASPRRPRRCRRTAAGGRGRSRGTAGPPAIQSRIGSTRPAPRRRSIAGAAAPTPGHDERVGALEARRVARRSTTSAPTAVERLVDADEVAGAVVDDGDPRPGARGGPRAHPSEPFVDATPRPARVRLAGGAQRAAERLERGLGQVVVVAARCRGRGASRRPSGRTPRARARRAGAAARRPARRGTAGR